jgi:hypothetical protein
MISTVIALACLFFDVSHIIYINTNLLIVVIPCWPVTHLHFQQLGFQSVYDLIYG